MCSVKLDVESSEDLTIGAFFDAAYICRNHRGVCKDCPGSEKIRKWSGAIVYECGFGKYLISQTHGKGVDEEKLAALDLHSRNSAYTGPETAYAIECAAIALLTSHKPKPA